MTPERTAHAEVKFAVQSALVTAIKKNALPCHMLPDGMTVRVADSTAFEPDALVYCGPRLLPSAIEVPNPVIVVEVLSPSTRHIDTGTKLPGYFRVTSVQHYLVVDPDKPLIIHYARSQDGMILTRIATSGSLTLDRPDWSCCWTTSIQVCAETGQRPLRAVIAIDSSARCAIASPSGAWRRSSKAAAARSLIAFSSRSADQDFNAASISACRRK